MVLRQTQSIIWISALLLLTSCEYELENENFQNIQPPDSAHPFSIELTPTNDTIRLFTRTNFQYNINTFGLNLINGEFSLGEKQWWAYSGDQDFYINPNEYTPGYYNLTLDAITNTGSGSLAEHFGAEGYKIEQKWPMIIDSRPAPELTPVKSITEDGYLKISWPKCDQYNFKSYQISFSSYYNYASKTIYDPDSAFYIDSSYVGGEFSFTISCNVYADNNQHSLAQRLSFYDSIPELKFEEMGLDSLRIFWDKSPYSCKYKLKISSYKDNFSIGPFSDTSYTVSHPGLNGLSVYLYIYPNDTSFYERWPLQSNSTFALCDFILPNWPEYAYNYFEKVVYSNAYDNMLVFDVTTANIINQREINNIIYQGLYSCPTNSSKVAAASNDYIYIFENKDLSNPTIIPYNSGSEGIDHFFLSDNNIIAIAKPNKYELYSVDTKSLIGSIDINDYPIYSKWACITTSKNCEHACIVTLNGLSLYSIGNDGNISLSYHDDRQYVSAYFNINDPSQLFLTLKNSNVLEIRNSEDFSLTKVITCPSNLLVIENIDPETGYLLLTDYTKLYILDINKGQVVLQIKSWDFKPKLYGNRIFTNGGGTADISKYIKK